MKVVSEFKYLGAELQRNGRWSSLFKRQLAQARHRTDVLTGVGMRSGHFSVESGAMLWTALVAPLLEYGTEVCEPGVGITREIETEQKRAAKRLLGCSPRMANEAVLGELGWMSMAGRRRVRRLMFFRHLVMMEKDRIVRHVFLMRKSKADISDAARRARSSPSWCEDTKKLLRDLNLEYWWDATNWDGFPSKANWRTLVHKVVFEDEQRRWRDGMAGKDSLVWYREVKEDLKLESYLKGDVWGRKGSAFRVQLRGGAHDLRASQGRHSATREARIDRVCKICSGNHVEDEYHFLEECPALDSIRSNVWGTIDAELDRHLMFNMTQDMLSGRERVILLLGGYEDLPPRVERIATNGTWAMARQRSHLLNCCD